MNLKKIINPDIRIDASKNYVNTSKGNFIDLLKNNEKITLIDGPKRLKKKVTVVGFRKKDYLDTIICVELANGLTRNIEIKYWLS